MELQFETIDDDERRAYERFFFERICSIDVGSRQDFTVKVPQVEGLYFTSVQDTVERLTDISGRLSTFQWRNCIFAPISRTERPNESYEKIFSLLKTKVPSLFVRSYVYLIFIKLTSKANIPLDFGDSSHKATARPRIEDYQIYFWNTKYQVRRAGKKNLFGDPGTNAPQINIEQDSELSDDDDIGIENNPEKLFIVQNPAYELQRIQDANSDIIDAFRAFNGMLPLVDQTKRYLAEIVWTINNRSNARVLVEGPARSGKTVLAMSLLAKYPKSKMLLMNWYFYEALIDAFKIWSELPMVEIEQLFTMPSETEERVKFARKKLEEFQVYQSDPMLLDLALRAIEASSKTDHKLPRWAPYMKGQPSRKGEPYDEWRIINIKKSSVGSLVPVFKQKERTRVMQIVEVVAKHDDGSASVNPDFRTPTLTVDDRGQLLEFKAKIEGEQASQYIAEILKDIANTLHNSPQRFFHHNLAKPKGCWIERGNPTTCNITDQDLVICDEVQRLGVIDEIANRDRFDEIQAIFESSKQLFLCGDDFQMLNPKYDQGIRAINQIAGKDIIRLKLPDSIGVPAEVGELIKYLLDEHSALPDSSGFEIQLLYRDDIRFVELFEADESTKKHYAIPHNNGFYRNEPFVIKAKANTVKCSEERGPNFGHNRIPMIPEKLRQRYKFFCSEAVMPNFALSAYELISREVESVYLKVPEGIGPEVVRQPIAAEENDESCARNWKKQHLYVLMTRATMRLVLNVENRMLYEYLFEKLKAIDHSKLGRK